jgi:hypothetical protein
MAVWLPLPFSLAALPTLREIGKAGTAYAEGEAHANGEPALLRKVG